MDTTDRKQTGERKFYRVLLFLTVALAAFSSAMNELNQLQSFTVQTGSLIASLSDIVVPTVNASTPVVPTSCVLSVMPQNARTSDEFRWNGNMAAGGSL